VRACVSHKANLPPWEDIGEPRKNKGTGSEFSKDVENKTKERGDNHHYLSLKIISFHNWLLLSPTEYISALYEMYLTPLK